MIAAEILKISGFPIAKITFFCFFSARFFGLPDIMPHIILTSPRSLRCVPFNLKLPAPWLSSELQLFYPRSTCIKCKAQTEEALTYCVRMLTSSKSNSASRTHERMSGEQLFHVDLVISSLNLKSAKKSMFVSFAGSYTLYMISLWSPMIFEWPLLLQASMRLLLPPRATFATM